MSHFTVMIVTNPDTQGTEQDRAPLDMAIRAALAPYDENIEIEPYDKGPVSAEDIQMFLDHYTKPQPKRIELEGPCVLPREFDHYPHLKKVESGGWRGSRIIADPSGAVEPPLADSNRSLQDLYTEFGYDWNGLIWKWNEEEQCFHIWSTYNPNSKWDWWCVGGRWKNSLLANHDDEPDSPVIACDSAIMRRIRWDLMAEDLKKAHEEQMQKALPLIEQYRTKLTELRGRVGNSELSDSEIVDKYDDELHMRQELYWRFGIETDKIDEYLNSIPSSFRTFAFLAKDGSWHERGQMLMFGMVTDEQEDWGAEWEKLCAQIEPNDVVTIVDCHI